MTPHSRQGMDLGAAYIDAAIDAARKQGGKT